MSGTRDNNSEVTQRDIDLEKLKCNVEIWKKVIDVQQHFNTIEMQIRNFAVTILAGIVAAAGLALREPKNIIFFNLTISSASAILIAGIIVLFSFYFMDRVWYHRLLQGAVKHGEVLETEIKEILPGIVLSQAIRAESHVLGIGSNRKIDIFYGIIIAFLIATAYGVNDLGNNATDSLIAEDATYVGNFNISIERSILNPDENKDLWGHGIIEIKSNKTKSDIESILEYIRI